MAEEPKHERTSDFSRSLCDLMLATLSPAAVSTRKFTPTWCGAHIQQRKSALYWVLHSKSHIQVFLRCEDTPEIRDEISVLLPEGVALDARPYPRAANWAKSTPLFLFVRTEEQARNMGPLLELISSSRLDPGRKSQRAIPAYWVPNSEITTAQFEVSEDGAKITVLINRYERNRKNRSICIKAHGALCRVCGFDFSVTYGKIGNGYIHVHHLTPLNTLEGKPTKIDPINDLIPVCPNCHEMLHQCSPPFSIIQLQAIIAATKTDQQK